MKKIIEFLSGKKTYIVAGIVATITFARMVGWLSIEQVEVIFGFLAAIGLYTIREAIKKVE